MTHDSGSVLGVYNLLPDRALCWLRLLAMGCGASREHAGPAPGAVPLAAETAEQRAAKLAELRPLTPEQEAAATKAAQRIGCICRAQTDTQARSKDIFFRVRIRVLLPQDREVFIILDACRRRAGGNLDDFVRCLPPPSPRRSPERAAAVGVARWAAQVRTSMQSSSASLLFQAKQQPAEPRAFSWRALHEALKEDLPSDTLERMLAEQHAQLLRTLERTASADGSSNTAKRPAFPAPTGSAPSDAHVRACSSLLQLDEAA